MQSEILTTLDNLNEHISNMQKRVNSIKVNLTTVDRFLNPYVENKYRILKLLCNKKICQYFIHLNKSEELELCKHNHFEVIDVLKGEVIDKVSGVTVKAGSKLVIEPYVPHHIVAKDDETFFYIDFAFNEKRLKLDKYNKIVRLTND